MTKIAFIGAGSFEFTRNLVRDILTFPLLEDATLTLMDIDPERLRYIESAVKRIVNEGNYPAKVEATGDRGEALKGASAVVLTILVEGIDVWRHDIEIPKKYGVDINVGDTRGPAGVFRALRTIPVVLDIAADMERLCPEAILLNYTNPMSMLCRAVHGERDVKLVGLCHSVQETAAGMEYLLGIKEGELDHLCAGINHQAWYLKLEHKGNDIYPKIREAMSRPEIYNFEIVRNEMFLHLGYYVTESSGHNSEYSWWFRKRPDLIERYCAPGTGWNPGAYAFIIDEYLKRESTWKDEINKWLEDPNPLDLKRGREYAAYIINAFMGGEPFKFNGNVPNTGLITNLPEGACVEVPVFADRTGFHPVHVGALPPQLAALNNINIAAEEMAVKGFLAGDPEMIYHSIIYDPLTAAVLSLAEIREMVNEMLDKNRKYLPTFKRFSV
ncbi:MAG: alpha-galactosidase [Deltaproteobacteria bacterium]|uniref:Alpha-galactosidase n=1 Tax=Candidatus Zymogenus saltonus TaxID=2844893 RepID=A0A9D8KJ42_9DELT|nr:alpha-galactosidase [Candidatus Zymogenus saltonus]